MHPKSPELLELLHSLLFLCVLFTCVCKLFHDSLYKLSFQIPKSCPFLVHLAREGRLGGSLSNEEELRVRFLIRNHYVYIIMVEIMSENNDLQHRTCFIINQANDLLSQPGQVRLHPLLPLPTLSRDKTFSKTRPACHYW